MPDALILVDGIDDPLATLPPEFVCSWTDGGPEAAWVHVAGELEIATAPQLDRTLRSTELQARLVVLDLRALTFIDWCGVHTIVDASNRAQRAGRRLVLLRAPPNVDRVLRLTGASDDLEIGDVDAVEAGVQTRLEPALVS